MSNKKGLTGFTLAEVLITLSVIGVVAAVSLPSLIYSRQKSSWVTGLKKAYAVTNQALQNAALEECGMNDIKCIYEGNDAEQTGDILAKYFNISHNCRTENLGEDGDSGCWGIVNENTDGTSSTNRDWDNTDYYKFITADGMSYRIDNMGSCSDKGVYGSSSPMYKTCGTIWIDVNGKKGPNYRGRDVFVFFATSNKAPLLYPYGGKDDNRNANPSADETSGGGNWWNYHNNNWCSTASKAGSSCPGRIMENNWQMDY